ncbi:MAG: hypothetical protein PUP90_31945 [Nostoc sp. S4]|nr:hypothetical protein [Nostoc sp. S4]
MSQCGGKAVRFERGFCATCLKSGIACQGYGFPQGTAKMVSRHKSTSVFLWRQSVGREIPNNLLAPYEQLASTG